MSKMPPLLALVTLNRLFRHGIPASEGPLTRATRTTYTSAGLGTLRSR